MKLTDHSIREYQHIHILILFGSSFFAHYCEPDLTLLPDEDKINFLLEGEYFKLKVKTSKAKNKSSAVQR